MKWLLLLWYVSGNTALGGPYETKADCEIDAQKVQLMTYDEAAAAYSGLMRADPVAAYCVEGFKRP